MNRYEFEDLISDYLEGGMSFKKTKEFEAFLDNNEEAELLVNNVRNSISNLNRLDKIVISNGFNEKLLSIIEHKKPINIDSKKSIYGFSPLNAAIFSTLCISIIFFSYSLIRPSNVFSTDRSENVNFLNENYKSSINSSLITDDNNLSSSVKEDSLKKSDKKYKVNKANKIKFVNN